MVSNILKHIFNTKSIYAGESKLDFITIGVVEAIDDDAQAGRIVVNINGVNDTNENDEKTLAFPLLPKHIQVMPKIGESVFVFKLDLKDKNYINRFWIGPIISQPQKLNKDPHFFSSQAALPSGTLNLEQAPQSIPEANGVYPDKSYISIQGRNNSDIVFKNNEVIIRSGQYKNNNPLEFNDNNIGYIQIKHDTPIKEGDETKNYTISNIVADKINFLTHNGTKNYNLTDRNELINNETLNEIINDAHPLVYGDKLIEYIKKLNNYVLNHVHPYHGLKPVANKGIADDYINFNLDSIISKNIKID